MLARLPSRHRAPWRFLLPRGNSAQNEMGVFVPRNGEVN